MATIKEQFTVKPSDAYFKYTLFVSFITIILLCILVTCLLLIVFPLDSKIEGIMIISLWVFLPIFWIIGALILWQQKRDTSYTLTDKSLIILDGTIFGGNRETIYRYDSMLSVESRQGPIGKHYAYGTIYINVPRLDHRLVLRGIPNPHDLARNVKTHVNELSSGSKALIT